MLRQFFDWLYCKFFGRPHHGYKTAPIEKSILRVLDPKKGHMIPELISKINYVAHDMRVFERILERLEGVGLARYKDGKWFKCDRRVKQRRVELI